MSFSTVKALYKKEMLDIFRDKKTIIVMLVVPLLLYPAIFFFSAQIMATAMQDAQQKTYKVAFNFEENSDKIETIMNNTDDEYDYSFSIIDGIKDCKTALENKEIDAYIGLSEVNKKKTYEIYYMSSQTDSLNVSSMLEEILLEYRNEIRVEKIESAGLNAEEVLNSVAVEYKDTASSEQSVGYLLGSMLPMILVTIIVMSATYPATDVTAGEKERGTLETMLTLPITSQDMFVSKFMAVATVAVFSAFANILSMSFVTGLMYTSILSSDTEVKFNIYSFVPAILIMFLCVVVFSLFMSALTMGICAMAKSFKEAQNYMTPFTLIVMFAGFGAMIPSLELTLTTSLIPVLNICLMIKQLLAFEYNIVLIFLVFISNILYAIISIMLLGKMYNSENIMFSESGSEIKLFERRANLKSGGTPEIADAVIILLVSIIAMFFISITIGTKNILLSVALPQIFFVAICIGCAVYLKYDIKQTFSFNKISVVQILGAIVTGIGMIMLNLVMSSIVSMIVKDSTENLNTSMELLTEGRSLPVLLLIIALIPAVCEEILFRGYFYASVRNRVKPIYAITIVSLVFGIYHMNLAQSIVTAIIGMILAVAVYKGKSIFASMIIHFMNNGISVICMQYPENSLVTYIDNINTPIEIILFSVSGAVLCLFGIKLLSKKSVEKL